MRGAPNMGKPNPRHANGHRRRKAVAAVRARHDDCHICGEPIDYTLPPDDPMSFSCDEIRPVSRGGSPYDLSNLAAAHKLCNMKRGNKSMSQLAHMGKPSAVANPLTLPHSRDW